jgi:hypothetical protein
MAQKAPFLVQAWLKDFPIEELQFLANLQGKKGSSSFARIVNLEVERRKNLVFLLPEANPVALAIEKAAHRGAVEGMNMLKLIIKYAPVEMERRMKEK